MSDNITAVKSDIRKVLALVLSVIRVAFKCDARLSCAGIYTARASVSDGRSPANHLSPSPGATAQACARPREGRG